MERSENNAKVALEQENLELLSRLSLSQEEKIVCQSNPPPDQHPPYSRTPETASSLHTDASTESEEKCYVCLEVCFSPSHFHHSFSLFSQAVAKFLPEKRNNSNTLPLRTHFRRRVHPHLAHISQRSQRAPQHRVPNL